MSLDRINLVVPPGEVYGYVGPNGAGKSTTARILSGLLRPTSGEAKIGGHSVVTDVLAARQKLGYLPESGAIFEKLTPREYLGSVGELYRLEAKAIGPRIEELLALFVLSPRIDERMDTFSKGMKQKMAIARALLINPRILIFDDSTSAVDAETEYLIQQALKTLMAQRTSFVIAQRISTVRDADQILVLDQGKIVASGKHEELLEDSPIYAEILASQFAEEVQGVPTEAEIAK